MNIALLASGKGSNVENILSYFANSSRVKVVLVGANNSHSGALQHAKNHRVSTIIFSKKELETTDLLLKRLEEHDVKWLFLAGFLLKIPASFIDSFTGKIVNIHPSLLPKYGGKGMYGKHVFEAVLENKEKETGITFHYVNDKYDDGRIIAQYKLDIQENDTLATLSKKNNILEMETYPKIIESLLDE